MSGVLFSFLTNNFIIMVVIAIVICGGVAFVFQWRASKRPHFQQESMSPINNITPPSPKSLSNSRYCKCGAGPLTLKELRVHIMKFASKEKGKHGFGSLIPREQVVEITEKGGYKAYVWEPNPGIVVTKITKPVGNIWLVEPPLPQAGANYFCKRDEEGNLVPYDPRLEKYDPDNSPERLYRATNAEEVVNPVYTTKSTWWERFNTLAPYIIAGLIVFGIIIYVAK